MRPFAAGGGAHGFHRVSVVILAIHDTSDILVDALKIVNVLQVSARASLARFPCTRVDVPSPPLTALWCVTVQVEGAKGLFATEIVFVSNLVVWIYFRLYVFPTKVITSVFFKFHE